MRGPGAKSRLRGHLRANVGRVLTSDELRAVAGTVGWARRVRELRDEEAWPIETDKTRAGLRPGQYVLTGDPPARKYVMPRTMSKRLRARVLARNGFTCQQCGVSAGERGDDGKPARLHIGHDVDLIHGGKTAASNLRALCSLCNEGARNLTGDPPRWVVLKSQIKAATTADQLRVYEWLHRKFGEPEGAAPAPVAGRPIK